MLYRNRENMIVDMENSSISSNYLHIQSSGLVSNLIIDEFPWVWTLTFLTHLPPMLVLLCETGHSLGGLTWHGALKIQQRLHRGLRARVPDTEREREKNGREMANLRPGLSPSLTTLRHTRQTQVNGIKLINCQPKTISALICINKNINVRGFSFLYRNIQKFGITKTKHIFLCQWPLMLFGLYL